MLVADHPDTSCSIKHIFKEFGFQIDVYTDPVKALSEFKPYFYDLSIIDTRMPELNGFELFEQINKLDSKIKICLMSSFPVYYQALREEHPTLDVRCFIKKPISRNDLVNRIKCELNMLNGIE